MKKFLSIAVVFVLVFSMCPAVFAAEELSPNTQALYQQYEQIIAEANEEYNCSLFLVPYEEMEDFCSIEEFRERVFEYCEYRNVPFTHSEGIVTGGQSTRENRVVTVPCIRRKTYPQDTIIATFYGTFDVRMKVNGMYYIASQSFTVYTRSENGYYSAIVEGNPTVRTVDGGRTINVTQQLAIYVQGQFGENTSVTATYIMNFGNGNITASS